VIIQSLFPTINGEEPLSKEIEEYAHRLKELKAAGANIPLVQIYSATRADVSRGVRTSAVENAFPHRADRASRVRPQSRSVLTSRFGRRLCGLTQIS